MRRSQAFAKLQGIKQEHLASYWDILSEHQKQQFLQQVENLDSFTVQQFQSLVAKHQQRENSEKLEVFDDYIMAGSKELYEEGLHCLAQGLVGCLVVAGGQGTRLGVDGPKGIYPVTVIRQKSLFQLLAEKCKAAGQRVGQPLLMAIMTSSQNHEQTVQFFRTHEFFGLDSEQVSFFSQGMSPFLDDAGNMFLDAPHHIAEGPNGNGTALQNFVKAGIWSLWKEQGVRYVNFLQVDNALADPFDAELIGFHHRNASEVTIKSTLRNHVDEKVGLIVRRGGRVAIVEYSEIPRNEQQAILDDGRLKHRCANISTFCLKMDVVKRIAENTAALPWHLAYKKVDSLEGKVTKAWKREKFIIDMLDQADKVRVILYPRHRCFAPLKNAKGSNTIESVKKSLQAFEKEIFEALAETKAPSHPFELAPVFYYPTAELISQWKGKPWPQGQNYLQE